MQGQEEQLSVWMGASPMLALGNIEWAGAKDILSHGRIKSPVGQEENKNERF